MSLREALEDRVARHPDRLAVRFAPPTNVGATTEVRQTYAELDAAIDRTAWALREQGARPGARVALMLPNGPEMVWCWLALAKLGATMVPVNTRLKGDSLRYLLGHAELDLAVVGGEPLRPFAAARRAVPIPRVIRVGAPAHEDTERWPGFGDHVDAAPNGPPPEVRLPPDGLAAIMYTSGTTGRPKAVLLPRRAQLGEGLNYNELLGLAEGETAYSYLPLFHVTAMGTVLGSLLAGGTAAIDPGFSPFSFWERTRVYGAAAFTFVGSVLTLLYNRPQRPDDQDNRVRRAVGAATPLRLWEAFERRFGLEVVETYGQTEMFSIWFVNPPEGRRVGTVGTPAGGRFEAKIADPETGVPLPPHARGEIAIRPRDPLFQAVGYAKDPEATRAAWRPDGWYYTGDLGTLDEDGYYRYVGRLKDCIRRRGENIAAYEIEVVVNAHPGVLESAAVGVPSELGEEEVKLCIVPRPDQALDPRELLAYCRAELPDFMVPRYIQLRDSLPKTATERVQKATLREEGTAGCWTPGRQPEGRPHPADDGMIRGDKPTGRLRRTRRGDRPTMTSAPHKLAEGTAVADDTGLPLVLRLAPVLRLSDDQLLALCAINSELWIERNAKGELLLMPPAGVQTGERELDIGSQLWTWAKRDGTGVAVGSSGGFLLPNGAMRAADAAWVLRDRWDRFSAEERKKFLPLCPDFVIELRSPSDRLRDQQDKLVEWIASGAGLGWLIDPEPRHVYVYRHGASVERHDAPSELSADPLLPGFVLDLREIW